MSDGIIDFGEYARRKEEERTDPERTMFAIWGGEGERTRFALPLWRAAGLVGGSRACLGWEPVTGEGNELTPLVVLDLASEPARTEVASGAVGSARAADVPPAMSRTDEAVAVYLGEDGGRRWYLVVDDLARPGGNDALPVDDLYFLAGECAGLLFHRALGATDE